jgi:hypothetical protein
MVTLDAVYLPDLGRVRITLENPTPGVRYRLQRSTDAQPAWTDVRGGGAMGDDGITVVDDYEYTPNVVNRYRVLAASFVDTFDRVYPMGGALQLSGSEGSYASTPDSVDLDITGEIQIRVDVTLDSWFGEQRGLVAKWAFTGDERSYLLLLEDDGRVGFRFTTDGTGATEVVTQSTVPVPVGSGRLAIKVTRDASTGDVNFYTAPFDSGSISDIWTQLGDTRSTTPGSMYSGTAPLEIGSWDNGTNGMLTGVVHRMILIADTGVAAQEANPDFNNETPGDTSFIDGSGNTWTINGDAEIIAFAPIKGSDWGTADTGQEWNLGGSSSGFAAYVDNGVGVIETILPNGFIVEMTTDDIPGAENAEITWSASYPGSTLDSLIEFNVGIRALGFDDWYEGQLFFEDDTGGTLGGPRDVFIRIAKFVDDSYSPISSTVEVGDEWVPNIPWHVRFRVNGSLLQMRAWQEGSPEPTNWQVSATDTDITSGTGVHVRAIKGGEEPAQLHFGPMELFTIPPNVGATDTVTPVEARTMLKSVTYPSLNQPIDCEDWDALTRNSRAGFFNIKGRHEILAITDVGSSATFNLTFVTRSEDENRGIKALLTYGGVLLLQPPGDQEDDCHFGTYSGTPSGYVVPSGSVQAHSVHGQPIWLWTVAFTKVAAADVAGIIPTTITWQQLWDIIGPEGTWETVWATWPTWQDLWLTSGSISSFGS